MERDSEEYKRFREEYLAEKKRRLDDPQKYPWFYYGAFGWHNMNNLTEQEAMDAVRFYKMHAYKHDGNGNVVGYHNFRSSQPIYLIRRKEALQQ